MFLKLLLGFRARSEHPCGQESHLSLLKERTDLIQEPVLECQKSVF